MRLSPRRRECLELLDRPETVREELAGNLQDIRRLNAWFGGVSLAWRYTQPWLGAGGTVTLLDVGTGTGDIPLALQSRAGRTGSIVRAVGLDSSPEILAAAAAHLPPGRVELVRGDARQLTWETGSFDVVLCCLALHHFEPEDAKRVLSEMWRVCRLGMVVTDLRRGYDAYAATWIATRTIARNRLTRHDGPLSTLRAYTVEEVRALAFAAGVEGPVVQAHPLFRLALCAQKQQPHGS